MTRLKKRKGMGFVTEHYVDDGVVDLLVGIISDVMHDLSAVTIRNLERTRELSVWADPRGVGFFVGHGTMPVPIPWNDLNVNDDDIQSILMEMVAVFRQHYDMKGKMTNSFKIILNDKKLQMLLDMLGM